MSRSLPARFISPEQLFQVRSSLKNILEGIVHNAVGADAVLIVRDLVPADFNGTGTASQYTNQALGAVNTYVAGTTVNPALANNQAVGVYGVADLAAVPTLMENRFQLGSASLMSQVRMDEAYATGVNLIYMDPPVIYRPLETINWQQLFNAATAIGAEAISLIGYICEPSGKTVTLLPDH